MMEFFKSYQKYNMNNFLNFVYVVSRSLKLKIYVHVKILLKLTPWQRDYRGHKEGCNTENI